METVDLSNFFSMTALLHFARAAVTFNISSSILKSKYNSFVTFFAVTGICLFYSAVLLSFASSDNEVIVMFFYYILTFSVVYFLYKGSIFAKLFTTVFSHAAYMISTFSATLVYDVFFDSGLKNAVVTTMDLNEFLFTCIFVYSFSLFFAAIIRFAKAKADSSLKYKTKYSFYYFFPIMHIYTALIIYQAVKIAPADAFAQLIEKEPLLEYKIMFSVALCLILDVCMIFAVDRHSKAEEKNIQNEKELLKSELDYNQMQLLKKEKSEFSKVKHDFINLLTTAKGFIEIGKPEKALEIIKKTGNSFSEVSGVPLCTNETINTIFYIKQQMAGKMGVTLKADIRESSFLKVDDYDLCRLLHNIIDNSINAVSSLLENKISEIDIETDTDFITVTSRNPYSESPERAKGKSDEHGHGINIIKDIAKKYSGTYSSEKNDGMYITVTKLRNISKTENSDK